MVLSYIYLNSRREFFIMKNDHAKASREEFLGKPAPLPKSEKVWGRIAGFALAIALLYGSVQALLNLDTWGPAVIQPTPPELLVSLPR